MKGKKEHRGKRREVIYFATGSIPSLASLFLPVMRERGPDMSAGIQDDTSFELVWTT